ncbi:MULTISPECIES: ATP-binding protein [Streptomyces]|uniref:ATP-binding protein n=2 Tax=Streptomyces violaceusniger group TaxID=2839105 RepID=A0ABD5J3J6_9ACTN|nr:MULTISPECIES: ATP-binding protein [Streptomyces]KUL65286.1 ATP-binding protein [Streptomyces violaceusniger]MEE4582928.1 ATP-binding protein [Streptomyces sp. DSM 41602]RSS42948.1 ATP-binding protein [Streptomyces sp. WAC05858]WJD95247.1 ATP-binding protein [Streptomyces antimycoticus]
MNATAVTPSRRALVSTERRPEAARPPASGGTSWLLPSEPSSVPRARRLTIAQLGVWSLHDFSDDAELLVSELVTNALRHAGGPIRLTFSLCSVDRAFRCEVADEDPGQPRVRRTCGDDEGGRGLHLLDLLSRCWGSTCTEAGKVVWFELHPPALALEAALEKGT